MHTSLAHSGQTVRGGVRGCGYLVRRQRVVLLGQFFFFLSFSYFYNKNTETLWHKVISSTLANRTELKWWKAPSPPLGLVGRHVRQVPRHCSFVPGCIASSKSPGCSLSVWQAALNTVHPQLCVQAVLGTEVVHSFGRLELKDNREHYFSCLHAETMITPTCWHKYGWSNIKRKS